MKKRTIFLSIILVITGVTLGVGIKMGWFKAEELEYPVIIEDTPIEYTPVVVIDNEEKVEEKVEEKTEEIIVKKEYTDFDFFDYIPDESNYMVSPLSLKMALMMAANGAQGDTQKEILEAFGIEDLEAYNESVKTLIENYSNKENVELNIANSIWLNTDVALDTAFSQEFSELILENYEGLTNEVTKEDAVEVINKWVEEKTNGKITNLLDNPEFLSVLINTLYFKGAWDNEFQDYLTEQDDFTDIDGNIVTKDFMNKTARFNYYEDDTMQMIRMPYADRTVAMYVVLEKSDEVKDYKKAVENMENKKINLSFPKFKVEYRIIFNDILKKMGIENAFTGMAEFNDMYNAKDGANFFISQVLQKTYIEVDEKGTEAAAATAIIMMNSAFMPQPEEIIEFNANKPFTYFIRDDVSGEILFLGKILY